LLCCCLGAAASVAIGWLVSCYYRSKNASFLLSVDSFPKQKLTPVPLQLAFTVPSLSINMLFKSIFYFDAADAVTIATCCSLALRQVDCFLDIFSTQNATGAIVQLSGNATGKMA